MNKSELREKVVRVVCDVLSVEPDMVADESNFVFDLGAESTQSVELVAGFEEAFGIEMDNESALAVQTVGEAVDFVGKYVKD
ncbi:MAG TPA: phosphopantetheine-binding protein [Phycisphaerae bacterium]|nr:phosphopantetheine-binding protein [Phycisphaerae bacterium]